MLALLQHRMGALGGLMLHFQGGGGDVNEQWKVDSDSPYWYCNFVELSYYRDIIARGELEKALLVFYTNLAYGMSPDMYQTVERVDIADSNYAPWQPNSSANGRILAAIRRMVIDEQDEADGVLWLLHGCPRRWFAPGKSVAVSEAPTLFGKMALQTASTKDTITIDVDPPADRPLKQLCVALRHPSRQSPREVTVNGTRLTIENEVLTLPAPSGHLQIIAKYGL